jgi:hypothetical protein
MDDYQKPAFEKERTLKRFVESPSILPCMPEIEDLKSLGADDYCWVLKDYLESHNRLKRLEINFEKHPELPQISSKFKLNTLKIFVNELEDDEDGLYLNGNVIDFIKSQAKSLKHLVIGGYVYNFDTIHELFGGMKELETVDLRGEMAHQSNDHLAKLAIEFQSPKVKKLILNVKLFEYPRFFESFPNLEVLYFDTSVSAYMVDSAAQSCSKIEVIYTRELVGAFENATFRNLIDLEIGQLNGGCYEFDN